MSKARGLDEYERAVHDLLDALAAVGNPQLSEAARRAAHREAIEAALRARQAALNVHEEPEEEEEIDLWVAPHLRRASHKPSYRLPHRPPETTPKPELRAY